MKNSGINKLSFTALTNKEQSNVKGGTTFCEWYVGLAQQHGRPIHAASMQKMMALDQEYGDISAKSDKKLKKLCDKYILFTK